MSGKSNQDGDGSCGSLNLCLRDNALGDVRMGVALEQVPWWGEDTMANLLSMAEEYPQTSSESTDDPSTSSEGASSLSPVQGPSTSRASECSQSQPPRSGHLRRESIFNLPSAVVPQLIRQNPGHNIGQNHGPNSNLGYSGFSGEFAQERNEVNVAMPYPNWMMSIPPPPPPPLGQREFGPPLGMLPPHQHFGPDRPMGNNGYNAPPEIYHFGNEGSVRVQVPPPPRSRPPTPYPVWHESPLHYLDAWGRVQGQGNQNQGHPITSTGVRSRAQRATTMPGPLIPTLRWRTNENERSMDQVVPHRPEFDGPPPPQRLTAYNPFNGQGQDQNQAFPIIEEEQRPTPSNNYYQGLMDHQGQMGQRDQYPPLYQGVMDASNFANQSGARTGASIEGLRNGFYSRIRRGKYRREF